MVTRMTFWFRHKYRLAPTDPRFLDMTMQQIETEYWAYHYLENPASEEVEDDEFDQDAYVAEINARAEQRRAEKAAQAAQALPVPPAPAQGVVNVTTTLNPLNMPDDWVDIE